MKILVVSDSHGDEDALCAAFGRVLPDMVLHLGDHVRDCEALKKTWPDTPLRAVCGNCDRGSNELDIDEFVSEGKRVFMTHGNLFGVKLGYDSVINSASLRGADILLFGHTHNVYYTNLGGIDIINPGSVGMGKKTYAVLEIEHGAVKCKFGSLK